MTVRRERLADAVLAGGFLAGVVAAAALLGVDPGPPAAGLGVVAVVAFEAVAGRYHSRVREWWQSPAIRAGSVLLSAVAVAAGTALSASATLSAAAGALVGYLMLLAAVTAGVVPPPSEWIG